MSDIRNDEAVSPVIGVILMVAITVILAAIIAAFVFGMTGSVKQTKTVGLTAQKIDSKTISLVNMGGKDAQNLQKITVVTDPAFSDATTTCTSSNAFTAAAHTSPSCAITPTGAATYIPVGTTIKLADTAAPWGTKTKVTAVGTFSDGSDYLLLDTIVTV
jgi:archaeal type IV pilus assembly protein PilA